MTPTNVLGVTLKVEVACIFTGHTFVECQINFESYANSAKIQYWVPVWLHKKLEIVVRKLPANCTLYLYAVINHFICAKAEWGANEC